MNNKIKQAHENIDGQTVARMIIDFQREFRDVYPTEVLASYLCAVGPLQSLLGLGIKHGFIEVKKND